MNRDEKMREILQKKEYHIDDLVTIVEILRAPGGCPWDREQTHKSMRNGLIEETYEVVEAIDNDDPKLMREELGDVLLQLVMHAELAREDGQFTFDDVANDICRKMILRHPHVFGEVKADTVDAVLSNWEAIKSEEKHRETLTSKLRAIPPQLPALMRATKVGKKAKMFDFPDAGSVFEKLNEELAKVRDAVAENDPAHIEEEIGDLLLTVTSLARKTGTDPEQALAKATGKFIDRFEVMEGEATARGQSLSALSAEELENLWQTAKKSHKT